MKPGPSARDPELEAMSAHELEQRRHEIAQHRRHRATSEFARRRQEQIAAAEAFERGGVEPPRRPQVMCIVGSQRRAPIRTSAPVTGSVSTEQMAEDLARLARELGWE